MKISAPTLTPQPVSIRRKPFYGWWVLLAASTVSMIAFSMSSYALPVFYPELVKAFHWPRANVALGGSMKTLLIGLLAPLNGWIIDRKGVKAMLLTGMLTLGISLAFLSGIDSLWQYYLLCLFLGLGASWVHHLPNQLLVANWFAIKRGLAIGILTTIAGFGETLLPILSGVLIKNVGWREALVTLPLLLIVPFLVVTFIVRNQPRDMGLHPDGALGPPAANPPAHGTRRHTVIVPGRGPGRDWAIFKTTAFWMLAGMLFLSAWADFSVWQHVVLFLRDEGYSPIAAASLFGLFPAASTVSRFFNGPLCDKISAAHAFIINLALMAFAFASLISTHSAVVIYLCMIFFGLGHGGTITCRPLIIFEHYGAAGVGKLYGVATALFSVGAFIGPVLAGYIHDKTGSYNLAFLLAAILACISIVLVILPKRVKTQEAT